MQRVRFYNDRYNQFIETGFTFAAKILKTETVGEMIGAIMSEIKIMEKLDHTNIVKYLAHDLAKRGEIRLYIELYSKVWTLTLCVTCGSDTP
jgi:hypothetical protein